MTSKIRFLVPLLPLALAACGTGATPTPTPPPTTAASSTPGAITGNGNPGFTLADGTEHDVCGIGVVVKFIPSGPNSKTADEAVLMGGPVSHVPDLVQDHTGADPLPANAARATAGTIATVVGKQFRVNAIDVAGGRVQLEPLC